MKKNIFLKISDLFNSLSNRFKTNDKSPDSYLDDFVNALQNDEPEKAHKAYDQHIMNADLDYSVFRATNLGNLNEFLAVAAEVSNDKKTKWLFYKKSFDVVVSKENEELFRYLFKNNHIPNPDTLLHTLSNKNAYKIALVVLYDLNFKVTEKMKKLLTCDNDGKTHTKMLALIEKRDLYLELGKNINNNQPNSKAKINKV